MANTNVKLWANSGDSHFLEPEDEIKARLSERLSPELMERVPRTVKGDGVETVYVDGQVLERRLPRPILEGELAGLRLSDLSLRPPGAHDVEQRLQDMDHEGVWGQVIFPSLGLWNSLVRTEVLANEIARVTNDWAMECIQSKSPRLVCTAMLPLRSIDGAIAELGRAKEMGFHSVFISSTPPEGEPAYNLDDWEPLWAAVEESGLVLTTHIGTGPDMDKNYSYRGPGGAVLNYVETTYAGQRIACQLVSSGALDRHPNLRLLVSEGGSAWVPFMGDRMTEAYRQHSLFVRPKLERTPKEILMTQVYTSFQHDESGVQAYVGSGYRNGMWGDDYPHLEGTFGHSQEVLHTLFDDAPEEARERLTIGTFLELFPHVGRPPEANSTPSLVSEAVPA